MKDARNGIIFLINGFIDLKSLINYSRKLKNEVKIKLSYDEELKEINFEITEKEKLIETLNKQLKDLNIKKKILIETNCEHVYKSNGYGIIIDGDSKTIMKCIKCGKIAHYDGIFVHELKGDEI
jgi:uncharacterized coiled-coil protein SlyX